MKTYTRKTPVYQVIENVHDLCRLCLGKAEVKVPIFTEDTNNVCAVLALRIMICVGLEINREDCLPNIICMECLSTLNKCYEFRKKCEVSYQKLKSHVLAVKEKQCQMELQEQNEVENRKKEELGLEEMFVVTFDKDQMAQVSILNVNGDDHLNNAKNVQETDNTDPDLTTFLSAILLQLGILTQQDDGPVLGEHNISSLEIETGDGSQITLELVEEDEPEPVLEESIVMEHPLDATEEVNVSEQDNVMIKYVAIDYSIPEPDNQNKKAVAAKKTDNKKNGAWCDECGKQLATRSALHRHRRIHSGEKPYSCQQCGRKFGQKEVMMRHTLIHGERRPHACASCPKSFTQRAALAAHARAHAPPHARALALHRCVRCPKVFLHASGLSRHMTTHEGRVFPCGACGREFADKSSLQRHARNAKHAAKPPPPPPPPPPPNSAPHTRKPTDSLLKIQPK